VGAVAECDECLRGCVGLMGEVLCLGPVRVIVPELDHCLLSSQLGCLQEV